MPLLPCCDHVFTPSSVTDSSWPMTRTWSSWEISAEFCQGQSPWLCWCTGPARVSCFLLLDESLLSCWFLAPPTTTVSPSTTSESTRTSITNIPRTTYTTAPKRKTTIPERNSTTTVVTDTHTTTGASTSALPMPTPTEDHKPGKQLCFWAQKPLKDWI